MQQMLFDFMIATHGERECAVGLNDVDRELIIRAQAGERSAMDEMLERHKGLIGKFMGRLRLKEHELDAVWNYGYEGLWEAIKRFDVDKGNSFATYAFHWIRQRILRNQYMQRAHCRGVKLVSLDTDWQNEDPAWQQPIATESDFEQERERSEFDEAFDGLLTEAKINARCKQALNLRRRGYSLKQIGSRLKVTQERARQLVRQAVGKARGVAVNRRLLGLECAL